MLFHFDRVRKRKEAEAEGHDGKVIRCTKLAQQRLAWAETWDDVGKPIRHLKHAYPV